jgi:hypothetical protein
MLLDASQTPTDFQDPLEIRGLDVFRNAAGIHKDQPTVLSSQGAQACKVGLLSVGFPLPKNRWKSAGDNETLRVIP